jgi:beta-barrel assembly-enhancing protease
MSPKLPFQFPVFIGFLLVSLTSLIGCKDGALQSFNLIPIEQDIEIGRELELEIASNPQEYPILPENGNEIVYQYVRSIGDKILQSGKVTNKDVFPWTIYIIHDDETINAFAAPGGFIYIYTGLIKFLDSEDQLAGVMAHEIAHADLRHGTRQLTKIMGVSLIAEALLGKDKDLIKQISTTLLALSFSREHETESDLASVDYLCGTPYNAAGGAGFFKKMEGQPAPPRFLSTHPNPANRVENIEMEKDELGCEGTQTYQATYEEMKALLPG